MRRDAVAFFWLTTKKLLIEVAGRMLTEAGYDVRSTLDATNAITIAREFQHTLPCWE